MLSKEEREQWIRDKSLEVILQNRDEFETDSEEWKLWNEIKAEWLEAHKPSTKEEIVYFEETSLLSIPLGFTPMSRLPFIPYDTDRRSILEYHPEKRHPIPYAIVKHHLRYFFILRGSGSGEVRLVGKKGLLGGHVEKEDVDPKSLNKTMLNALRRELVEEAGITDDLIRSIHFKGLLKSNEGVDADHLGVIYEIELETDDISAQEQFLKGIWLHKNELEKHYDSFESWAKIVYDNLLKQQKEK